MVQKDLKIGLVLGLILVIIAVIKLATDPRLSPKARMMHLQNAKAQQESPHSLNDYLSDLPESENMPDQPSYIELQKSESASDDFEPGDLIQIEFSRDELMPGELKAVDTENRQSIIKQDQSPPMDVSQYVQAEKIKTQRFHIVRKDQTLSAISRQYYGSPNKWQKIVDANRDVIKDPNKLQTGMKLIIPD